MTLNQDQFGKARSLYGAGDVDALFHEAPMTVAPWPRASRLKTRQDYDKGLVHQALRSKPDLVDVDPRELHATQTHVTRAGVQYYMGEEYQTTGRTFADQGNAGNAYPVVYHREDGQQLLLSGHHRAARALLRGEPLKARKVEGPWGPPRG